MPGLSSAIAKGTIQPSRVVQLQSVMKLSEVPLPDGWMDERMRMTIMTVQTLHATFTFAPFVQLFNYTQRNLNSTLLFLSCFTKSI